MKLLVMTEDTYKALALEVESEISFWTQKGGPDSERARYWADQLCRLNVVRAAMTEVDPGAMLSAYCEGNKTIEHVEGYSQCVSALLAHIKEGK